MALTPTTEKALGFTAPQFQLLDTISDAAINLNQIQGKEGTVVMFICNHCPYVVHVREQLVQLANDYLKKGIGFVAISSNDAEKYPEDAPDKMKALAHDLQFPFPYLYDKTQQVAKDYDAACTPDFSIFDAELKCVYRGQLDDSRPNNNIPVTGNSIREVLDLLIEKQPITGNQKPSIGCNIKWINEI